MAKLLLEKGKPLIYLGLRQWTKQGTTNTLNFAKFGDAETYVNHEFIVDPTQINLNFPINTPVEVEFALETYNNRSVIRPLSVSPVMQTAK